MPAFFYTFIIAVAHIFYMYTQNGLAMISIMITYNLYSTPYFGLRKGYPMDTFNLSKESEKRLMNDKRFDYPL